MSGIIHQKQDPNAIRATGTLEKRSPGDQAVQVLLYVLIALIALLCVLPFIYVIAGSFATEQELTERPFFLIPHEFSLNAYSYILKDGSVFRGLKNSFLVTIVGTLINMFVSCTLAYPLSRSYLKGRNGFINMVIVTMLFSGGMVPSYILVMNILDLGNTFWALWLPGAMSAFNMIIIKNYFQGLPNELEEAAIIDGSNDLITFVRIILPLSTPVLASVALFYAVGHWNSYFNAMMYINDPDMELMTIVLRRMVFLTNKITQDSTFDWGAAGMPPAKSIKMATTVVATVPMLCIYPFVQKYFTQGIMVGSVKGLSPLSGFITQSACYKKRRKTTHEKANRPDPERRDGRHCPGRLRRFRQLVLFQRRFGYRRGRLGIQRPPDHHLYDPHLLRHRVRQRQLRQGHPGLRGLHQHHRRMAS